MFSVYNAEFTVMMCYHPGAGKATAADFKDLPERKARRVPSSSVSRFVSSLRRDPNFSTNSGKSCTAGGSA